MASSSMSSPFYTEEEIQEMQQILLETPIDPSYDEICDSLSDGWDKKVLQQMAARSCYRVLKGLDRLPPDID